MSSWRWHYNTPEFTDDEPISTDTDTNTEEDETPIIAMAGSSKEEMISKEMKKKLKTPTPYSGKREDLHKFLQEIKIYLLGNEGLYPSNQDKILFVLLYMSDGDANTWKEEYLEPAEQSAAQNNTPLTLRNYNTFLKRLTDDFSPYDAPKDAIHDMKVM